ncbi:MAG: hypothetical protein WCP28_13705, partial [Actinomycetes bacterium]
MSNSPTEATEPTLPRQQPTGRTSAQYLRRDVWLSALQVVLALLLCLTYVVFLSSFSGEFLLVVKGSWLLPVFLGLVLAGTVVSVVLAIRSRRSGRFRGEVSDWMRPPSMRIVWLVVWSLALIALAVPVLSIGRTLTLGAMGGVPTVALALVMLPVAGYAAMFVVGGVRTLWQVGRRRPARLMRGGVAIGLPFVLVFASFALVSARWMPHWAAGVQH